MQEGCVVELRRRLCSRMMFGTAGLRAEMGAGFACINDLTVIQSTQVSPGLQYAQPSTVRVNHSHWQLHLDSG